jgi:hypothetical protein
MLTMKNNHFNVSGNATIIQAWDYVGKCLRECWIDTADLALVDIGVTWYAQPAKAPAGKWYATAKRNGHTILMHRVILGVTDPHVQVDHRDNDGLNNIRDNLRTCTHKQNQRFRQPWKDWDAYDERKELDAEYRQERSIARQVALTYDLTRQALWKIRLDASVISPASQEYRAAIAAAGVRDLMHLHSAGAGNKPKH